VNTETTVKNETKGWLFYDADCSRCVRAAARSSQVLARFGFQLSPLQTPGTPERVGVSPEALRHRMHLLTREGGRFAGADALIEIARHVRWARPFLLVTRVPGVPPLLRRAYDAVAARRYCLGGACRVPRLLPVLDGLPLLLLLAAAFVLRGTRRGLGSHVDALALALRWLQMVDLSKSAFHRNENSVRRGASVISWPGSAWSPNHLHPGTVLPSLDGK
jgi:predicted DCC family thiol-disulfide oxidoreductase YuxK